MKASVACLACVVLLGLSARAAEAKYTSVALGLKALNLTFAEQLLSTMRISLANKSQVVTLLAPSDAVYAAYLSSTGKSRQSFFANAALVRSITLYSILPGIAYPTFKANLTVLTQLGQFIRTVAVSASGPVGLQGYQPSNIAFVTNAVPCGNGLILVMNAVLVPNLSPSPYPPSPPPSPPFDTPGPYSTVLSALQQIPAASNIYNLIQSSSGNNLTAILGAASSRVTVFAVVDSALASSLASLGITLQQLASSPFLPMLLCYGVLNGAFTSSQLTNNAFNLYSLYGLTPIQIYQTPNNGIVVSGNSFTATIISPAIKAGNSYLYLVDALPVPGGLNWTAGAPGSVQQAILQDPSLTVLQSLAKSTGALNAVGLTNPNAVLTFFAPTDAAINTYLAAKNISLAGLASNSGAGFKVMLTAQSFVGLYTLDELASGSKLVSVLGVKSTVTVKNSKVSLKPQSWTTAVNVVGTVARGPSWIVYRVDGLLYK